MRVGILLPRLTSEKRTVFIWPPKFHSAEIQFRLANDVGLRS